jgi:ubiquinone/menaquinone biosynthesis C-methylase UbiE
MEPLTPRREEEHDVLNERKWDSRAETYDRRRFDYMRLMQERLLRLVMLKPGMRFLDVGCGTGWAVRRVAALLQGRGEFYGVDLSARMIEVAVAACPDCENVRFLRANAERLPMEGEFFDCVVCSNSFHHYLHPSRALAEIRRVLKPGGRLYIMDLTADGPLMRRIDARVRAKEPEHVRFYSSREYRSMFGEALLRHVASRITMPPVKVHIAEKPGGTPPAA